MARNTITTSFLELVGNHASELGILQNETTRYRLFAGKSARLLRRGDLVPLTDLHPEQEPVPGVARVTDTHLSQDTRTVFVMTEHHSIQIIPASRLVLVHRGSTDIATQRKEPTPS